MLNWRTFESGVIRLSFGRDVRNGRDGRDAFSGGRYVPLPLRPALSEHSHSPNSNLNIFLI